MISGYHFLLPSSLAERIASSGARWGYLDVRVDEREQLVVVSGFSAAERVRHAMPTPWLKGHYSSSGDVHPYSGVWYRVHPDIHVLGIESARRQGAVRIEAFRKGVQGGWRVLPPDRSLFALTLARASSGDLDWAGWRLSREGAAWVYVEVVDEGAALLDPLQPGWDTQSLADALVTVVGVGSIGSAAVEALAGYAIRKFALVDPDRLHQHNFARHRAHRRELGRLKVNAVADVLLARDPDLSIERYPLDVIDDADVMRPLFARSDAVLACTDGVASRRVANHLARRSGVPLVLACVLEDGAFGEVLRLYPRGAGCLLCHRDRLVEEGGMDPEPDIDLGYGTGQRHRPMTAVGGDLGLMGQLAAKAVVATLLETKGDWGQRLPGDHAVVGLNPVPDLPSPFDIERPGEIRWWPVGPPRADCPTCSWDP